MVRRLSSGCTRVPGPGMSGGAGVGTSWRAGVCGDAAVAGRAPGSGSWAPAGAIPASDASIDRHTPVAGHLRAMALPLVVDGRRITLPLLLAHAAWRPYGPSSHARYSEGIRSRRSLWRFEDLADGPARAVRGRPDTQHRQDRGRRVGRAHPARDRSPVQD